MFVLSGSIKTLGDKPVPNRDMFIPKRIVDLFPVVRPVLHCEPIEKFFAAQDQRAIRFKILFVVCGRVCLALITLLLIVLSWRLSLLSLSIELPLWLDYSTAALGLIALGLQLFISISQTQSKWLYARYAADVTRQWKYQNFLDGQLISKLNTSIEEFNKDFASRWLLFKEQFKHGMGGMRQFIESSPFEFFVTPSGYQPGSLLNEVRQAYETFRLRVQISHLADKNLRLRSLDSWTDAIAKGSLVASGLIAISEAFLVGTNALGWGVRLGHGNLKILTAILAGSSLSFAVISAGTRVFRSASAITEERERYRSKELHLSRVEQRLRHEDDPTVVLSLMKEAETICTEELQEFLRSLRHADYFF